MNTRLLCLGLAVAAAQLFATGCHPVARFRANHPYIAANGPVYPILHPIETRRALIGAPVGYDGPGVGPIAPPCHGCGAPGVPVSFSGGPFEGVPVAPTGYPPAGYPYSGYPSVIGSPKPLLPGPTVVPSNELHMPTPMPPKQ